MSIVWIVFKDQTNGLAEMFADFFARIMNNRKNYELANALI